MKKPILAATGLDGLIGSQITPILSQFYYLLPLSQKEMDIRDEKMVNKIIGKIDFDYFLHMAAYTDVDSCETQQNLAYEINVKGTSNLFSSVNKKNKLFIYISTDFVFDGKNPPFIETSIPNPVNYYGKTKYLGEKIIGNKGIIARLSYPFGYKYPFKKDIVHTIVEVMKKENHIYAVNDNLITLTYIKDIAYNIHSLIKNGKKDIYHISGNKSLSSYELFQRVAEVAGIKTSVKPIDFSTYYKNRVTRPQYAEIKSIYNNLFTYTPLETALKFVFSEGN